jgi:signal transduction histidine kinase
MMTRLASRREGSGAGVRSGFLVVLVASGVCLCVNGLAVLLPSRQFAESPDVVGWLVGVVILVSGAYVSARGERTAGGVLMVAAVMWQVPDLARLLPQAASDSVQRSALVHIALVGVAVLLLAPVSPGRAIVPGRKWVAALLVVAACSGWTGGWRVAVPVAGASLLMFVVGTRIGRLHPSNAAIDAWAAAGTVLGVELVGSALVRALDRGIGAEHWLSPAHQLAIAATSALLAVSVARTVHSDAIELGFDTLADLEPVLASALGVRSASVALAADGDGWLDVHGAAIEPPPGHGLLVHDQDGDVVAFVGVGEPGVVDVPASAQRVLRLARDHARLRATITGQLSELEASRRRILLAQDRAWAEIHAAVRDGPLATLVEIERDLSALDGVGAVRGASDRARANLERLAYDLDPVGSTRSLAASLEDLVEGCPAQVEARIDGSLNVAGDVARTVWFTVCEALSNVVKHAPGATARVTVAMRRDTAGTAGVVATIVDNGPGGADPNGSGLRGLADRADALGGSLRVARDPAGGTRVELRV